MNKTIITAAVTGSMPNKEINPAVPYTPKEIAIIGAKEDQDTDKLKDVVFHTYIPNRIIVGRHNPDNGITSPLLDGKEQQNDKPTAYVCENYTCLNPTNDPRTLLTQLSDE